MKKLLILGYVWPEPNSSAAGSRMMDLIRLFQAEGWQITFASAAALSPHRFKLAEIDVTERSIELNSSSFDQFVAELQPQAVIFDRFFTEEQFGWRVEKMCPHAIKILDTEDLHCLRFTRQRLLKEKQKQFSKEIDRQSVGPVVMSTNELYREMLNEEISLRELAAIYRCDLSLIISRFEMELLTQYFRVPEFLLIYCPYASLGGLPYDDIPTFEQRHHFLFIGNFRHEPNWDAVLWLKYQLWPKISAQLPAAELHIYGAYPPPKAAALHNQQERFLLKGWAENSVSVTGDARVTLSPLRFGAGLKGKLFESIKCGTPGVTSSIGVEGIATSDDWPGVVADDADEFAAAAVKLYSEEAFWSDQNIRIALLLKRFAVTHSTEWIKNLDEWISTGSVSLLSEHRSKNFFGKLLGYESYQAHKYMGLWIEAKNK
jgi:O-antigen biosynthesis protein